MSTRKNLASLILIALLPSHVHACGWDDDTLSAEAKGLPQLVDAIVGRIPIYPQEYYQFRIDRSSKIVLSNPGNFEELDNLIVAYDKLGNSQKSFYYCALKKKALEKTPNKEHEYRYYANLGTVEAHTWVRNKNFSDKKLLDQAISNLKRCVAINPDAHFGREIVQIELLERMRSAPKPKEFIPSEYAQELPKPPSDEHEKWVQFMDKVGIEKVQKGIIGIMSLGSGPDNPDLVNALIATIRRQDGVLRELALHRLHDLWRTKPLLTSIGYEEQSGHPMDRDTVAQQYQALVKNTDEYRKAIDSYIIQKIKLGKHPDVDAHFWDDWQEPNRVDLRSYEPLMTLNQKITMGFIGIPAFLISFAIGIYFLQRRRLQNR